MIKESGYTLKQISEKIDVPLGRFFTDYETDQYIMPDAQERELLLRFNEFSAEQKDSLFKLLDIITKF